MSTPPPGSLRPDRQLLKAWLLLFLARGSGYGYGLAEQLREQALDVEMTVAYRVLRALERDRLVTSRWIDSSVGPPRRLYSLTATGRRTLDALFVVVTRHRDRYHAFVHAYDQAGHPRATPQTRAAPAGGAAPAGRAAAPLPERELRTAWLLLMLSGDASYGYDLQRHLAEHDVKADPGKVYRVLRRLDADGWLRSRWSDPVQGPRRRVYRLTAKGRRNLDALAGLIRGACIVHDAFVTAYEQLDDDYRGPAVPRASRPARAALPARSNAQRRR